MRVRCSACVARSPSGLAEEAEAAGKSKHKAMSYDRMGQKQRQLRAEVQHLLAQAEAADAAKDAEYGADRRGDELPAELQRREIRLARIREAKRPPGRGPKPRPRPRPPVSPRIRRSRIPKLRYKFH